MKKRFITPVLIATIAISSITVFANGTDQINNQLEELSTRQENINSEIQQKNRQQRDAATKLQELEQEILKIQDEIAQIQREITTTERQVQETIKELTAAEEEIDSKNGLLGNRINAMYRNGPIAYIEVIFSSSSFSELLTNLDMVQRIVQHDVDLLKELEEQKALIEDKKVELENKRSQLVVMRNGVEQKRDALEVSRGQQRRLSQQLEADKATLARQLDNIEREARKLEDELRRLQSSGDYVGGVMQWPAPGHTRVTSPFGNRIHPILRIPRLHTGVDIATPTGANIVAAAQGTVVSSHFMGGYGNTVIIDHGGGIMTLYAHNSRLLVSPGQQVSRGQSIALAGSTGDSTGPHLHFEVRENGRFVDPLPYIRR
ncbi:peptidoglycan DD-metalloendopeptidase family protein [Serpentinicella sp. ANB-PHB4]|uniref:murein hydrolase activator EnvC family protein n=1 Tax=Serpentinicella sp. ANB-PHB4 TaxID=3074076 RepID=UPI00285920BC|nr:peptidoglycan DD-metalloendopeptidase family protein [Serpentinicella sp. ANB-PHB4]MDR5659364.1 peptidoglycan DD-metalloendopeptidase family protein [Serpentinicella sp. ANB-PHB4]